uniref:Uncharacterized protein n=1 Tax=Panagrolaimus sp. PS1159 TaxID=55785 RepID=A0AC35FRG6_9BILA
MNLTQVKEIETMNGHLFRVERNKISYRRNMCDKCKKITDATHCDGCRLTLCKEHWSSQGYATHCDGCRLTLCKEHWSSQGCTSDYGKRMLKELKSNVTHKAKQHSLALYNDFANSNNPGILPRFAKSYIIVTMPKFFNHFLIHHYPIPFFIFHDVTSICTTTTTSLM